MPSTTRLQLTRFGGPIQYDNILHPAQRAIVVLDRVRSSGVTPGSTITAFLEGYGDVIRVHYPETIGFNGKKVTGQILDFIQRYRQIVFVSIGPGGLLAYDIIALAKQRGLKIDFRLGLINAPTGRADLKHPLSKWVRFIPALPFMPASAAKLFPFYGDSPEFDPELDDADMEELDWHNEHSAEYRFGPGIRQTAYITTHPALDEEVLDGVIAVYARTNSDPHVRWRAQVMWSGAYWNGPLPGVIIPVNGHDNPLAHPREWMAGLKEMFEHLDVQPLV